MALKLNVYGIYLHFIFYSSMRVVVLANDFNSRTTRFSIPNAIVVYTNSHVRHTAGEQKSIRMCMQIAVIEASITYIISKQYRTHYCLELYDEPCTPILPYPTLPCPALPYPILPCPALPSPALPCPAPLPPTIRFVWVWVCAWLLVCYCRC